MAKAKKSDKARVPQSKLAAYWGWTYPKNTARKALRLFKRLNEQMATTQAVGKAVDYCRYRDAQAQLGKHKPMTLGEAAFQKLLSKHVDEGLKKALAKVE